MTSIFKSFLVFLSWTRLRDRGQLEADPVPWKKATLSGIDNLDMSPSTKNEVRGQL